MLSATKLTAPERVTEKANKNGREPRVFASHLLQQGREFCPDLSMKTINNYIIYLEKESKMGQTISMSKYLCQR